ncbi:glycosyl hydrolase 5 family protein-like [Prosopis cineraria]|uniref:glycosyl hydrolase 5 family protein-like n=1 Tax=Prosopis cineraria TaxID=364024 RepID=UPI00241087D6|nr:glycosyl hydrolase 5 family protein-like [Prosopis cineraria]
MSSAKSSSCLVLLLVLIYYLAALISFSHSLPLSTNKRWIVDEETGKRVKLVCAHWVGHLSPMLVEGLDKSPLNEIVSQFHDKGFNCVRLSYSTYLFTRYANQSAAETLAGLDLPEANVKAAIAKHNPWVLNMTHLEAYEAVVDALDKNGVMIIIDNHVIMPNWCCDRDDGNGFFGDRHFDPHEWLRGLDFVATHFKAKPHVIAVDLRNELRGARQNKHDWYEYMGKGARTIHEANPKVLVIISGLNFDSDFTFLKNKSLDLEQDLVRNKLVYEVHLYSFTGPAQQRWTIQPLNRICADTIESVKDQSAFLMSGENAAPLFVSEFGYDMRGLTPLDNNFVPCFTAYAAAADLDWSLWAFGGSYYERQGQIGLEEAYAVLDGTWKNYRDPNFTEKFQLLQRLVQGVYTSLSLSHTHARTHLPAEIKLFGTTNSKFSKPFELAQLTLSMRLSTLIFVHLEGFYTKFVQLLNLK